MWTQVNGLTDLHEYALNEVVCHVYPMDSGAAYPEVEREERLSMKKLNKR